MAGFSPNAVLDGIRTRLATGVRGPRTAVVVGRLLGVAFVLCFVTGLYSHVIQDPLPWMVFPTRPTWLYQATQGVHITSGILCFPLIVAKLYAVYPKLFETPVIGGVRQLLERASIAVLVAASLVQIVIGLLNTYQLYAFFAFPFRQTHFALSFLVIGSLAIHIGVKLPIIAEYWTARRARIADRAEAERAAGGSGEIPPPPVGGVTGRVMAWMDGAPPPPARRPARRAFLAGLGAASVAVVVLTAGQSTRLLDATNLFAPRKRDTGPNGLPVNRTAHAAKVVDDAMSPSWRLTVVGATTMTLSRADLEELPQHEVDLPIACVEGWSQLAHWRGPRLKDVMDAAGADPARTVRVTSLEQKSIYAVSELPADFARDDLTLLALELDGEQLDIDHGYPVRLIAPARPGVLQTKWLSKLEQIA